MRGRLWAASNTYQMPCWHRLHRLLTAAAALTTALTFAATALTLTAPASTALTTIATTVAAVPR